MCGAAETVACTDRQTIAGAPAVPAAALHTVLTPYPSWSLTSVGDDRCQMAKGDGKRRAPLSLLIVEDEPRVAWVIRAIFERSGHSVTVAASIGEARAHLATATTHAVVVDFILPDGDGLAFARSARDDHGVGIIVMSGLAEVPDSDDVISLLKPFTPDQLEHALAQALAQSRASR